MKKLVYISTPLKPEKFNLRLIQKVLKEQPEVFAFIPPQSDAGELSVTAEIDRQMIDLCDEVWAFGPIGRDCAWEIGYAMGRRIPVIFFSDNSNQHIIYDDAMMFTKGLQIKEMEYNDESEEI